MAKIEEVKENEIKDFKIENNLIADPFKDEQDAAVAECLANGCSNVMKHFILGLLLGVNA